jgi:putative SOS response-associated peptidase YedK
LCNLYSITTNQAAIAALFRVVNRYVGNLAPMPGVFPDYPAPVIRNTDTGRELSMMRWGMPPPPRTGGPPVTNIRNTSSPHWLGWLKPENRCLVPFNSFAEYAPQPNPETKKKDVVWFAINDDRPLTCFAGIWTEFKGDRGTKSKPVPGPHNVYGFLTTSPNAVVGPTCAPYELGIVQRVCPPVPGPVASALSSLLTLDGLEGKRFRQKPEGRRIHRTAGRNGETPMSRQFLSRSALRIRAKTGPHAPQQPASFSITSSARTRGVCRNVRPNGLRSPWERTDRRFSPSRFFAK